MAHNIRTIMNPWEVQALNHQFPDDTFPILEGKSSAVPRSAWSAMSDPVFYPGLYSPSGYDMMTILLHLMRRPNPQIELGPVDCSTALVLCDLRLPDEPIVYVSDAFCELTGYRKSEIIGRNCRFIQKPPSRSQSSKSSAAPRHHDKSAARQMRHAIQDLKEIQVKVVNYRKNGTRFNNLVSIVPLQLDASGYHAIGFAVEVD